MPIKADIVVESLGAMTTPIDVGLLIESSFADGIPLTLHQARAVHELSVKTVDNGGFYTMNQLAEDKGTVFLFFNAEGKVEETIVLNQPNIAKDRKIPSLKWMTTFFEYIDYAPDRKEIKAIHTLLESHIRDGGSWEPTMNSESIKFVLRMNGHTKARYEFYREVLGK